MKNRFLFLLLFCCCHTVLFAQNQNRTIDSLLSVLKTAKEDTAKVNTLTALSIRLNDTGDPENAKQYADSALVLADKLNFKKGEAMAYNILGQIDYAKGTYPQALKNFLASLKLREEIGDKKGIANSYNNIGIIYESQGNYPEAMKNHLASLRIREEIGDKQNIAKFYNNIGIIYQRQGNFPEALKNYFASLKISEEFGDKGGISTSYNNIGSVYSDQGNYPEALKNYLSSLEINEEIGDKETMALNYNNIGVVYADQGTYRDALKNYLASLKIYEEIEDKHGITSCYISIGELNIFLGNFSEARKYLNDALSFSKEIGSKINITDSYGSLSALDSAEGNFAQALEHYKMYTLYKDSMLNEESNKQTAQLKIQYETERKDREIAENKVQMSQKETELTKKSNDNRMLIAGVAGLILLIVFGSVSFIQRQKLQNRKKEIEKHKALEQNRAAIARDLHDDVGSTLSSIRIMSTLAENNPQQSVEMVKNIRENSQRMLENMSDIVWAVNPDNDSFSDMLVRMNQYAAQMMEPKGIHFKITADGGSENAQLAIEHRRDFYLIFKEAINNLTKYSECTEATIIISGHSKLLIMKITDNGKGFNTLSIGEGKGGAGNGLKNMCKRAENINGELKISSLAGKGTIVELQIPVT